ncbi:MAG: DMT family transporter [Synergistaceae bacterium]|nr:DMT family transporter [Synergistaceae bacterium]
MNTQKYIDGLFANYEETPALADFKEELRGNLNERIENLVKKGMPEQDAFQRATSELGDISVLAEEISLKKKQEVYEDMYMGTRKYMTPKRTAAFVLGGTAVCFGLISAAIVWFSTGQEVDTLGGAMVFCVAGAALLTFMALTQETAAMYPMPWKRAVFYAVSVGVFVFGVFILPMTYFEAMRASPHEIAAHGADMSRADVGFMTSIGTLIPFALPSAALFVFLALTEKDRRKPWAVEQARESAKREMEYFTNPTQSMRLGLVSGAIWITAIASFIILTIRVGILYSWLALVGAIVLQLLAQALFFTKGNQ